MFFNLNYTRVLFWECAMSSSEPIWYSSSKNEETGQVNWIIHVAFNHFHSPLKINGCIRMNSVIDYSSQNRIFLSSLATSTYYQSQLPFATSVICALSMTNLHFRVSSQTDIVEWLSNCLAVLPSISIFWPARGPTFQTPIAVWTRIHSASFILPDFEERRLK